MNYVGYGVSKTTSEKFQPKISASKPRNKFRTTSTKIDAVPQPIEPGVAETNAALVLNSLVASSSLSTSFVPTDSNKQSVSSSSTTTSPSSPSKQEPITTPKPSIPVDFSVEPLKSSAHSLNVSPSESHVSFSSKIDFIPSSLSADADVERHLDSNSISHPASDSTAVDTTKATILTHKRPWQDKIEDSNVTISMLASAKYSFIGQPTKKTQLRARNAKNSTTAATAPLSSTPPATTRESSYVGPKIRLVDGKAVIDTLSLSTTTADKSLSEDMVEIEEHPVAITSASFSKRHKTLRWGLEETELFYRGLEMCGTDFGMVAHVCGRTRKEVKLKFNKEEKVNPMRVDKSLSVTGRFHELADVIKFTEKKTEH